MVQTLAVVISVACLASISCTECPGDLSEHQFRELYEPSSLLQLKLTNTSEAGEKAEEHGDLVAGMVNATSQADEKAHAAMQHTLVARDVLKQAREAEAQSAKVDVAVSKNTAAAALFEKYTAVVVDKLRVDAHVELEKAKRAQATAADISMKSSVDRTKTAAGAAVMHMNLMENQVEKSKAELEQEELAVMQEAITSAQEQSSAVVKNATVEGTRLMAEMQNSTNAVFSEERSDFASSQKVIHDAKANVMAETVAANKQIEDSTRELGTMQSEIQKGSLAEFAHAEAQLRQEERKADEEQKEMASETRTAVEEADNMKDHVLKEVNTTLTHALAEGNVARERVARETKYVSRAAAAANYNISKAKEQFESEKVVDLPSTRDANVSAQAAAASAEHATKVAAQAAGAAADSAAIAIAHTAKLDSLLGDLDSSVGEVKRLINALNATVAAEQRWKKARGLSGVASAAASENWEKDFMFNDNNPLEKAAWKGHPGVLKANNKSDNKFDDTSSEKSEAATERTKALHPVTEKVKSSAPTRAFNFGWLFFLALVA